MIRDMGNVELFELFETDSITQCKECLLYWSLGIVFCTCGHLLKESAANRGVIEKKHWTFTRFKIMSLRRGDLMAIDMGRLKNKETFILHII